MAPLEIGQAKIRLHMHPDIHYSHLDPSPFFSMLIHVYLLSNGFKSSLLQEPSLINPSFQTVSVLNLPLSLLSPPSLSGHVSTSSVCRA